MPPFANAGPVDQRLSHFIGSMPILLPLGGSVAEVRRTQEKTLFVPMEAVPRSSELLALFRLPLSQPDPAPPFSFHAAAWSMIGSILSSFLPISRLAISTS